MSYGNQPPWRRHVCGLYYITQPNTWQIEKNYLPVVELEAHATILATTSRTVLTQIFLNPSYEKGIKEVRYTFPLYDGVSVVGFTCHVGDRTIVGEVKEKEKAKAIFKEAVARGETAGLLEQLPDASDVFHTTVGNIPPGAKIIVKTIYLGELKHDMEVDGIRYTIPNVICPRYGSYPGTLRTSDTTEGYGKSISITVDTEMADGSFIQKIQSPSHPIAMAMGTVSTAPHAEPAMNKASASLTLGTASLETDFVVQIIVKDIGVPKAVLESHPTIPNHRALMATLVPRFRLPAEKPEIVFVCDQSGSMRGDRNNLAVQALKVFLRSLPVGVKFNICRFGSNYSFLWPQSVTYSQKSLDEATSHIATFCADYGGTEMLKPLKATIEQRYKDIPLEIMLLTDGEIWNQQDLFTYLNESIGQSRAPIRVFTLGMGNGVSHALIEGIAKAGNGFSQTVGEGEMLDNKVVRMLKGALSPHITDYSLEVKYRASSAKEDEDFEIIEKIADSLKVKLDLKEQNEATKKPISLFDTSVDLDEEEPSSDDHTGEARYAHLPKVPVPKIIQAPQHIPALFAFNRTSIYLLLGPEAPSITPKSIVLRGTSAHGPLELEIPIQILDTPGEIIHQLAAKKAISELEQGRGWLSEARDDKGILLKTRMEGKFSDMVECEAVRLGVQFQVGGKWCSFVAVETKESKSSELSKDSEDWEWLEHEHTETTSTNPFASHARPAVQYATKAAAPAYTDRAMLFGQASAATPTAFGSAAAPTAFGAASSARGWSTSQAQGQPSGSALFRSGPAQSAPGIPGQRSGGLFGNSSAAPVPNTSDAKALQDYQMGLMTLHQDNKNRKTLTAIGGGMSPSRTGPPAPLPAAQYGSWFSADHDFTNTIATGAEQKDSSNYSSPSYSPTSPGSSPIFAGYAPTFAASNSAHSLASAGDNSKKSTTRTSRNMVSDASLARMDHTPDRPATPPPPSLTQEPALFLHRLIALQSFSGAWSWNNRLEEVLRNGLGLSEAMVRGLQRKEGEELDVVATAVAVAVMEEKLAGLRGSWELVVEKARGWLDIQGKEGLVERAAALVRGL